MLHTLILLSALGANDIYGARFQPLNVQGFPYPGAKRECMTAGGTWPTNALAVYSDAMQTSPLANPVVADANGRFPVIYLKDSTAYKFIFLDANNNTLWTDDNVYGPVNQASVVSISTSSNNPVFSATNTGAGPGIQGINTGSGVGLKATGLAASPIHASLLISPQTPLASSPAVGEVQDLTGTGLLELYTGNYWQQIGGQVFSLLSPESEATGGSATSFTHQATIAANSLVAGSRVHIKAGVGIPAESGTPSITLGAIISPSGGSVGGTLSARTCLIASATVGSGGNFDAEIVVDTSGSGGTFSWEATWVCQNGSALSGYYNSGTGSVDTTKGQIIALQYSESGGSSSTSTLNTFIVDQY